MPASLAFLRGISLDYSRPWENGEPLGGHYLFHIEFCILIRFRGLLTSTICDFRVVVLALGLQNGQEADADLQVQ